MVMCSAMESIVVPRPPALPISPLVPHYALKQLPIPPPPPPKPFTSHVTQSNGELEKVTINPMCHDQETGEKKVYEERKVYKERRITQKMVDKKIIKNESIRSKISSRSVTSQRSNGFRLIDSNNNGNCNTNNNDDTGSIYSIYKQKIDSMFESDSSTGHPSNHNSVQAKIEKMFTDVAKDSGIPAPSQTGVHAFSVDYLGSVSLHDKVTSLDGLQNPLRELYFSYKKLTRSKKVLSGRLEISSQGLRVQYQGQSGDLEQMNSFPTIAVWSAVKFVIQENSTPGKNLSYAFLPLITDPDNMDKQMLFRNLEEGEKRFIHNEKHSPLFAVVMRKIGVQKQLECHGFVCQTSEDAIVIAATLYKSLVNHMKNKERRPKNRNGVTTCMSTTSSNMMDKSNHSIPVRPPRKKRNSTASSIASDNNSITNTSDTQPLLSSNNKPPKRSTKLRRAPKAPEKSKQEDLDAILPYEEPIVIRQNNDTNGHNDETALEEVQEIKPKTFSDKLNTYMSKEQKQITAEIKQVVCDTNKGLKRAQSVRKLNEEEVIRKKENSGDIFTKVTIPRSGSFLNTGGLTRYKNKVSRNNDSATGGSPIGFKEIFNELSLQEGLHSMEDILSVIIDRDGMSFNNLKPIYKEFLLKLAVTLTKDELYLKSKSIMRRQKKKIIKRSPSIKKTPSILVSGKFKKLKHIFQKTLKAKSCPKNLIDEQFKNAIDLSPADVQAESKLPESSISTSSYDTRQFRTKDELAGNKKQGYRKKTNGEFIKNRRRDRASTSEESDFFSLKRQNKLKTQNMNLLALNQNRNSSSGYVSCSECSYDSDTCTCVSADKCYCSLGQKNFGSGRRRKEKCLMCTDDPSLTYCDCDTDSCAESNKCYCSHSPKHPLPPPSHPHHKNCSKNSNVQTQKHKKLCKKYSNTRSTRSLEYMSNPSEGYYEKLRSKNKFGSERVPHTHYSASDSRQRKRRNSHIGIGGAEGITSTFEENLKMVALQNLQMGMAGGQLSAMDYELLKLAGRGSMGEFRGLQEAMCRGGFCENVREYWGETRGIAGKGGISQGGQRVQSAITTGACTEALSVKKSAEIAALFADIKLSQTTDITHLAPQGFEMDRFTSSMNMYNTEKSITQAKYSKPHKSTPPSKVDIKTTPHQRTSQLSNYARPSNVVKNKSKLYSARNGLYTIQSQSDESRRSSLSAEGRKIAGASEIDRFVGGRKNISSNIENSLGYLP